MTSDPSAAPPRRARDRRLCAGQEHRAGRRQGVQAVVQRDAARPEPEGDRGLQRGRRHLEDYPDGSASRSARGDRPRLRARSGPHRLRRGLRRSAQPARRAPISATATRRSTPRTASWSIRSRRIGAGAKPVVAPEKDFTADVDAILKRVTPQDQGRLPRQPEQSDRHLHAVRRGQAPAQGPAAACAAGDRRRLCRIRAAQRLRSRHRAGRDHARTW